MKKLLCALLVVMMSLSLVACGGNTKTDSAKQGGTYIVQSSGEPATLNPDAISDDYNYAIAQNIFNRLYKLNNAYEAIPDLAKSYDLSEDGLTYTFHLNEGIKWHDGEAFSSDDVVYSYTTIMDKQYANASVFVNVKEITAPDANTVVFNMKQPDGSFVSNLAWYGCFVLPKHLLEGTDWLEGDFNQNPVGTGPFKFDQWNKGTDIQIVRNDDYFGDKALLDKVIFTVIPDSNTAYQAWLNDEVDEVEGNVVPASEKETLRADSSKYTFVNQLWPTAYYLTFNLEKGPFANKDVRQAVCLALDKQSIVDKASGGYFKAPEYTIPSIYTEFTSDEAKLPAYDQAAAMAKLEAAGYTKNADGYYFETTLKIMSGFDDYATCVVDALDQVGIKAKLEVLDYNIWYEQCLENYQFEFTMLGGFQGPDILGTGRRWTTSGTINVGRYSNTTVDELYNKALAASSNAEIKDYFNQIQAILVDDMPNLPIAEYNDVMPYKSYIKGHPYFKEADGGALEKTGFSEYTYVWLDKAE